jgi:hypothetical protein
MPSLHTSLPDPRSRPYCAAVAELPSGATAVILGVSGQARRLAGEYRGASARDRHRFELGWHFDNSEFSVTVMYLTQKLFYGRTA